MENEIVKANLSIINPEQEVEFGRRCAKVLMEVINAKPKPVMVMASVTTNMKTGF
jgi:hypothetical protein